MRATSPYTFDAWDRETLRQRLPEADVAFTPFVDRDVFASAARLRWVQSPAAGVGSLMFPELLASAVVLTSARGIRARSIAEHVLGVTIALARRLPAALRAQAAHRWAQDELETDARTLHGQRLGIVGLGAIGVEVVKIAAPFGFRISASRRRAGAPRPEGSRTSGRRSACPISWRRATWSSSRRPTRRRRAADRPGADRSDETRALLVNAARQAGGRRGGD